MDNINNEIPLSEISKFLKDYYNKFGNFDNLIKHISNEVLNPIKTTNNFHKEKNSRFVNMSSFENIETIDYAVLSLVSKEELLYLQNIPEIVEQISNEVNPEEIAQNLETKTGIPLKVWIEFITALLLFLAGVLGLFSDSSIEVNINNYNTEITEIDINPEKLQEYLNQIENNLNQNHEQNK